MKDNIRGSDLEEFKYLIDSRNMPVEKRKKEDRILLGARKKSIQSMSDFTIRKGKLMQLYFQMNSYLDHPKDETDYNFTEFLRLYVDGLYSKRKDFATDLNIKPITLSQVLNRHREPQEIFLRKLVKHSENVYAEIGYSMTDMWPRVYYQDKLNHFISLQEQVMEQEGKYVSTKRIEKLKP